MPEKTTKTGNPKEPEVTVGQLRTLVEVAKAGRYQLNGKTDHSSVMSARGQLARLVKAIGNPDEELTTTDGSGGIRLTPRGERLLPYAEAVAGIVAKLHEPDRSVRVAVYSSLMLHILTCAAQRGLATDSDSLGFWFAPADVGRADGGVSLTRRLARHDIDIAVAPDRLPATGLDEQPLYFWELRALGALPASDLSVVDGRPAVSIEQLARHPLLVSPSGYRSRQVLEEAAGRVKVPLNIRFELSNQGLMQRLTRAAPENDPWIAVMPSDAYGIPEADGGAAADTGVAVVEGDDILGDSYSIYRRSQAASLPTEFERRVDAAARTVASLLDPSTWDGAVRPPVRHPLPPAPGPAPTPHARR